MFPDPRLSESRPSHKPARKGFSVTAGFRSRGCFVRTGWCPLKSWRWSGSRTCRGRWPCIACRMRPATRLRWQAVSSQTLRSRLRGRPALTAPAALVDPPPKKAVLSTTVPKDFHFSTDGRIKAAASSQSSKREVDFIHQLRKPASPVSCLRLKPLQPKANEKPHVHLKVV